MRAVALVVAAGSGERLGADVPKAFVECAGRPLLEWSLQALSAAGLGDDVVVAVPAEAVGTAVGDGSARLVAGGATRSASVKAAFAAVAHVDADAVIVHDAARPLVPPALFASVLTALEDADAATAAAPVADTVKVAGADRVVTETLDRSSLWAIQTPQAFRRDVLARALDAPEDVLAAATDDCSLVEARGGRVVVVPGPPENFKVTTPHDLRVASLLLSAAAAGG